MAGSHREDENWKRALVLSELLYRAAEAFAGPSAPRLAAQVTRVAARLPAVVLQARRAQHFLGGPAEAALLEAEALLLLSVRLGALPEPRAAGALAELAAVLRSLAPDAAPSPEPVAPRPGCPAGGTRPRAAAAPVPAPAPEPPAPVRPVPPPIRASVETPAPARGERRPLAPTGHPAPAAHDRLFLDGCNFLGRAPGYDLGDAESRDRLLLRLQEYARRHPAHGITVFFDGQRASRRTTAGVKEQVTSGQRPADDVMIDELRRLPAADRRRAMLITDDRELAARAHRENVRVEGVAWLLARLTEPRLSAGGPPPGLSRAELSEWEAFFAQPPKRPGR